jgi:3-phosphoshikimate 1-carboxyvinyltransferase
MMPSVMNVELTGPAGAFAAEVHLPGDKSMSHRALILAAMAHGTSRVVQRGPGADVQATVGALASLGVDAGDPAVVSPGVEGWSPPPGPIDVGNSGTTMRMLSGALAGRPFSTTLIGDASLMQRPMARLVEPLATLGASLQVSPDGTAPVTVDPAQLRGAKVSVGLPSAQVRTAVALAALQAEGPTEIESPPGFRDHTERWLAGLGLGRWVSSTGFRVEPGPVPPTDFRIPGDASSAAYLAASAALVPGALVHIVGITLNPGRTGFFDILEEMGASVVRTVTGAVHGDPIGDVTVRGAALRGVHVRGVHSARTIDELPLVAVLAGIAAGETHIRDAAELTAKESDRIATTVALVRALGGEAEATADGMVIAGGARYGGGTVRSGGDHRIAMSAAVAATISEGPVAIEGFDAVAVSWPGFRDALEDMWSSSP